MNDIAQEVMFTCLLHSMLRDVRERKSDRHNGCRTSWLDHVILTIGEHGINDSFF
jgi:hypothetical protein